MDKLECRYKRIRELRITKGSVSTCSKITFVYGNTVLSCLKSTASTGSMSACPSCVRRNWGRWVKR